MKRALIVGINYVGTQSELRGCINDARNMQSMLVSRGFEIEMCLERSATTAGIKAALERLVAGAVPGDVLVFHYSGHGSQLPSDVETDGYEEIICPIDLDWRTKVITDDDLRNVFNKVLNGVNITVILDCCHSGTALDQVHTFDTGLREHGFEKTREAIEGRYLTPPPVIEEQLWHRTLVNWSASRDVNETALLIAGCRSDQTSADAFIEGTYQGACTYALLKYVDEHPEISYAELITNMNRFMLSEFYDQRPQLDGSPSLWNTKFLASLIATATVEPELPVVDEEPVVEDVPAPSPSPEPEQSTVEPVQSTPAFAGPLALVALALAVLSAVWKFFTR